jgi:predicted permease
VEFIQTHGRLAAVAALFFVGVLIRRFGWAGPAAGRWLLNFAFNVALPILVLGAVGGAQLTREHALLPAVAIGTVCVCWAAAAFGARRLRLSPDATGAFALSTMSMNVSMIYPFAALSFTPAAFAELVMFDMGHAVMVWTVGTFAACHYANRSGDLPLLMRRVFTAPALWMLFVALALNLARAPVVPRYYSSLLSVGQVLVLLVPLAMGLLATANGLRRREVLTAVVLRAGLGALAGFAFAHLSGLDGRAAIVATVGAAAPVGFSAVVLSAREGLDLELAASAAAISVFAGSLWIPFAVAWVGA